MWQSVHFLEVIDCVVHVNTHIDWMLFVSINGKIQLGMIKYEGSHTLQFQFIIWLFRLRWFSTAVGMIPVAFHLGRVGGGLWFVAVSKKPRKQQFHIYLNEKKEWFVQYTETQNLTLNRRVLRGIIRGTRGLNSKACGTPKGINGL